MECHKLLIFNCTEVKLYFGSRYSTVLQNEKLRKAQPAKTDITDKSGEIHRKCTTDTPYMCYIDTQHLVRSHKASETPPVQHAGHMPALGPPAAGHGASMGARCSVMRLWS